MNDRTNVATKTTSTPESGIMPTEQGGVMPQPATAPAEETFLIIMNNSE